MSLVVVCSGKGSPGATYCAINLAASFARANQEALLVDFDAAGGDIGAALGLDPRRGLHPLLATTPEFRNDAAIEAEIQTAHGIKVLAGFPDAPSFPEPEAVRAILGVLTKRYSHLIVDLGRITPGNAALAIQADLVLTVCRTDLVSVLGADRALRLLGDAGVQARQTRLVVNAAAMIGRSDPLEVARTLGIMALGVIPDAARAARTARAGLHPVDARRTNKAFDRLRTQVEKIPQLPRTDSLASVSRIGEAI